MLSKETFIDTIKFIEKRMSQIDKINDLFTEEFEDSVFYPYLKYENKLVSILEEIFNDKETQWISYYLYELDCGKSYKDGDITEKDKDGNEKIIPLKTPEDLYNLLIEDMER